MEKNEEKKDFCICALVYLLGKCTHKAPSQNNYSILSVNYYNCRESNLYDPKSNSMKQSNLRLGNAYTHPVRRDVVFFLQVMDFFYSNFPQLIY